jgi:hypothetical protein
MSAGDPTEEERRAYLTGSVDSSATQTKGIYDHLLKEAGYLKIHSDSDAVEQRFERLERAMLDEGSKDSLLVATNQVLSEENKRLTAEVERLMAEQAELHRRLDEAHDRLYKTIDILQEQVSGRTRDSDRKEDNQEAERACSSSSGAEQAARGSEHDAEGGQRQTSESSEGPRGTDTRALSVVVSS